MASARIGSGASASAGASGIPLAAKSVVPENEKHGNFDCVRRVTLDYAPGMSVEKWVSRVTGLTVVWANFESPLLNSYVTMATEIFEDSGVPHTLEHLIFLGSKQYPFKGVLDSLANRAFAQGTNAWTANDHTAYTLTTAGSDGFLRMLPVYLDHIFFPTLTDSGFVTEVYHINGKGEDAGVVYSEMQGRENSSGDLMELKVQRMLYPRSSAYRSETGGLMSALRVLTIDEIRSYHKKYYAPHNSVVVVCGPLDRKALLDSIAPVEQSLVESKLAFGVKGPDGWKRPFLETGSAKPPVIDGSKRHIDGVDDADEDAQPDPKRRRAFVDFPEKDESMGEIEIIWLGPKLDDWLGGEALSVLSTYLTDTAVSPVHQAFIERDDPYCTDASFGNVDKAGSSLLYGYFTSVPTERLDQLDRELVQVFEKVAAEGIDMTRMATIIKRERLKLMSQLESKPADSFADVIIGDFLYGQRDGSDLEKAMDDMRRFDTLSSWTSEQWIALMKQYFTENARLVVIGRPSAALADKLRTDTKALVDSRQKELGEQGLKKLEERLEAAKKENDKDIPPEMLSRFRIPGVESIQWISVGTGRNLPTPSSSSVSKVVPPSDLDRKVQAHIDADGPSLPFFVQFDHANSAFLTVSLILSTADLPAKLRPHITLYLATLFALPVKKQDGSEQLLSYEEVIKLLDEDTLEYESSLGVGYGFSENICIDLKVEKANYDKAISWLRDLVWGSDFAIERLKVVSAKLSQSLPEQKRDGRSVVVALLRSLTRDVERSSGAANTVIEQSKSLPEITKALTEDPQGVVKMFEEMRSILFRPENIRASVAGDVFALPEPRGSWRKNFVQGWQAKDTLPVPWTKNVLTALGQQPAKKALICSLPTIESSFAFFTAKGLEDYQHPDNAALVVAISVLNAMESYLWRYIRGAGLAYGASISSEPEAQLIHFSLYRSPDSAKAFLEARKVVQALANGEMELDETTVESAKSSLHFSVADSEGTVGAAATESFIDSVMKATGKNRGKRLLQETSAVTLPQIREALKKYILPIFDPATSIAAIASAPTRVQEMADQLKEIGYDVETRELDLGADDGSSFEGSETGSEASGDSESEPEIRKGHL